MGLMSIDLQHLGSHLHYGKIVIISLIVGLIIRAILIPFTSSPFDVAAGWVAVIDEIYAGHSLYDGELYKYTPLWGYILAIESFLLNLFGVTSFGEMFTNIYPNTELTFGYGYITNPLFNVAIKMPGLIFDVLTAFASYYLVKDLTGSERKAEIGFAMWFLCPIVIMSSAILCMFDCIMMFFMIVAFICFRKERMFEAGVCMSLAILTKAFPAMLLPVMVAYILGNTGKQWTARFKELGLAAAGFCIILLIVYLMPLLSGEFEESLWFLTSRSNAYSGLNIESLGFNNIFFYMPLIIVILLASCATMAFTKKNRDETFLYLSVIVLSLMFCFPYVSYTPTYGIVMLLPILILYSMKGKIAWVPWVFLLFFVAHGLAHYWETWFYPLAAFTDFMDITDIVENMGNGSVYYAVAALMSSGGFVLMMLSIWYFVIPRIKELVDTRRLANGS